MTAAGFDSQVGYAAEVTPGTFVAPTRAIEHVMAKLKLEIDRIPSKGIKAGRRHQGRWLPGAQRVTGTIAHELASANIGQILRMLMGAVGTTGVGPYVHTFTPGVFSETQAMTVQVGKPDETGVVRVFSYLGMQVTGATITSKVNEIAMLELEMFGQHLDLAQSITAASYSSTWSPFTFLHGSATIAAAAYEFDAITLKYDNKLKTNRHVHRITTPSRPKISKESEWREWGGTINSDFFDLTALNRFINGTEAVLVLTFDAGASSKLVITANVRFDGEDPAIDGAEMVGLQLPFVCVSTTSDALAMTMVLTNSDATP